MRLVTAVAGLLVASSSIAQNYLPEVTSNAALLRSQTQCQALRCDGVFTKYWWTVQPLTDGTAALVIQPGTPYDITDTVSGRTGALTAPEQTAVVPRSTIQSLIPAPDAVVATPDMKGIIAQ
jgi:hypothetical protein